MNKELQLKMEQYKKMAVSQSAAAVPISVAKSSRVDSLSQVIRSKEEADIFMDELESAFKRAK